MVIHYGLYYGMALFGSPESEVSIGLHERTGPCDEKTKVYTAIGGVSPCCDMTHSVAMLEVIFFFFLFDIFILSCIQTSKLLQVFIKD